MARLTLMFFTAGTVLVLVEALQIAAMGQTGAATMTAVGLAGGSACVVLRWCGERLAMGTVHALLALSVVLVAIAAASAPTTATATAIAGMCAFTTFAAVYTCSPRAAAAHVTFSVLSCLTVLVPREGAGWPAAVMVTGVFSAVGYVLGPLVARAASAGADPLTGLLNRRGHEEAMEAALADAQRSLRPLTLALIDVDHFKAVNDSGGHAAGDAVLRALAAACTSQLPIGARVARVGGDEFAILLPATASVQACHILQALRDAPVPTAHSGQPVWGLGRPEALTTAALGVLPGGAPGAVLGELTSGVSGTWGERLSIGVAQWRTGQSAADLVRRADAALYQAKSTGRARLVLAEARDALTVDLAAALAADDISVALQPVVAVATSEVVGVEALARWNHPERGSVSPADFIAAAEESGLIIDLGRQVLAQAAAEVTHLRQAWGAPLFLTVNASGLELIHPGYVEHTLQVVDQAGLPAHDLVIEVTESTLQASSATALRALEQLRTAGVRVAVDDFGTGYSTMARLDEMPADFLKLDHTFTRGLVTSERRRAMLVALQQMAAALGMQVIVEGVETQQDLDHLLSSGCALAQGYFFQRPVPLLMLLMTRPRAMLRPLV